MASSTDTSTDTTEAEPDSFDVGDVVTVSDGDDDRLLVVETPEETADEYPCDWDMDMNPITVYEYYEDNQDFDCDPNDAVVNAVYFETLNDRYERWRGRGLEFVLEQINQGRLSSYSFPAERLAATDDSAF